MSLRDSWELRNAATETLIKIEFQLREALRGASAADLVVLLESFSPARSPGPEWTRSFDALVEHLWTWCEAGVLAEVEAALRARGGAWATMANALTPTNGEHVRARLQRPSVPSRVPPFSLG